MNYCKVSLRTLFIIICMLCSVFITYAQTYRWAKNLGGSNFEEGKAIVVDNGGNVYSTGKFSGTADFDPGPAAFNLTAAGFTDVYISKLDSAGNFLWAKGIGGSGQDAGLAIALDGFGNVYITGEYYDSVDFDPGPLSHLLNAVGVGDMFILKLDAAGNFIWAKSIGGSLANDTGFGIVTDSNANVYTTGCFKGTADFDPGTGVYNLTATDRDIFIAKHDSSGSFVWARHVTGGIDDYAKSITLDAAGNVYCTGNYVGTADFDPGPAVYNLIPVDGGWDGFTLKLDNNGNFLWATSIGNTNYVYNFGIKTDTRGNVIVAGIHEDSLDFDPDTGVYELGSNGMFDCYISKSDSNGNLLWARSFGGTNNDFPYSLAVDTFGNIYTTGNFSNTADFDPGAGTYYITPAGMGDVFILKLDSGGTFVWAKNIGGPYIDDAYGLWVDNENLYVTGDFPLTANFNLPGLAVLTGNGSNDAFVAKYSLDNITAVTAAPSSDGIKVYPNPASESFTIDPGRFCAYTEVTITSVLGVAISRTVFTNTALIHTKIDAADGVYFLRVTCNSSSSIIKVVKH